MKLNKEDFLKEIKKENNFIQDSFNNLHNRGWHLKDRIINEIISTFKDVVFSGKFFIDDFEVVRLSNNVLYVKKKFKKTRNQRNFFKRFIFI